MKRLRYHYLETRGTRTSPDNWLLARKPEVGIDVTITTWQQPRPNRLGSSELKRGTYKHFR